MDILEALKAAELTHTSQNVCLILNAADADKHKPPFCKLCL